MADPQVQSDPYSAFGGAAVAADAPAAPTPPAAPQSMKFGVHTEPDAASSAPPPTAQPAADPYAAFGGSAVGSAPAAPVSPMDADKSIGPEERAFLKNNPKYKYLPKDSRFPNRQPGIYPTGPGNEWRDDPNSPMHDTDQAPIDLHFAKHTLQGAGTAAAMTAPAVALPAALPVVEDLAGQAAEYAEYYGNQAKDALAKIVQDHPKAVLAAKGYGIWLAGHVAAKLGIPMPKILKTLAEL